MRLLHKRWESTNARIEGKQLNRKRSRGTNWLQFYCPGPSQAVVPGVDSDPSPPTPWRQHGSGGAAGRRLALKGECRSLKISHQIRIDAVIHPPCAAGLLRRAGGQFPIKGMHTVCGIPI